MFGFVFLILIEIYLRIQHNIDRKAIFFKSVFNNKLHEMEAGVREEVDLINNNLEEAKDVLNSVNKKIVNSEKKLGILSRDVDETDKKISLIDKNLEKTDKKISLVDKNLTKTDKKIGLLKKNQESEKVWIDRIYRSFMKRVIFYSLKNLAPDVFSHRSVLYVGARPDRFEYLYDFKNEGYKIDLIEIYKENYNDFKRFKWLNKVILGDITKFNSRKKYDVIFWWHGPEHVEKKDFIKTLKKLENTATKMVVLGMPWGNVPQRLKYENPYEEHVSFYDLEDFENLGYNVDVVGDKNNYFSQLTAVKFLGRKSR